MPNANPRPTQIRQRPTPPKTRHLSSKRRFSFENQVSQGWYIFFSVRRYPARVFGGLFCSYAAITMKFSNVEESKAKRSRSPIERDCCVKVLFSIFSADGFRERVFRCRSPRIDCEIDCVIDCVMYSNYQISERNDSIIENSYFLHVAKQIGERDLLIFSFIYRHWTLKKLRPLRKSATTYFGIAYYSAFIVKMFRNFFKQKQTHR